MPWVGLQCGIVIHVFTGQTQFLVISSIYYSQNRSALSCKLKRDNSLLTIYSVNYFTMLIAIADLFLSYDVASGSEITPCNKIDKPLVVYRFTGNVMTSIATLRT